MDSKEDNVVVHETGKEFGKTERQWRKNSPQGWIFTHDLENMRLVQ